MAKRSTPSGDKSFHLFIVLNISFKTPSSNALKQAVTTLEQRTKEIIAMNIIIADKARILNVKSCVTSAKCFI